MAAKYENIKYFIAIGVIVLLAVTIATLAENPAEGMKKPPLIKSPAGIVSSSLDKIESPYEILQRTKGRQETEKELEAYSLGPVVAKAELIFTPTTGRNSMSYLAMNRSTTTPVRPPELHQVPADAPAEPAYFKVKIGDRDIWGLTYRSKRDARLVKLLLDTNSDGLFSDEREYLGTRHPLIQITLTYFFGPIATQHGDVGIEAGSCVAQCSNGKWLVFQPAIYREGQVLLDGKTYKIALVDNDFDGKYNRFFVPPAKGSRQPDSDAFAIDLDGDSKFNYRQPCESELMPLSRLVKVNETYYNLQVAENGSIIEFRTATPQYGQIDFGSKEIDVRLWSDTTRQWLKGSGRKRVPTGRYSAVKMDLTEKNSAGENMVFSIDKGGAGQFSNFEVRPGEVTSFRFGPPFQIKTSMERSSENAMISFSLEGQAGELYKPGATINGKEVPEPQFKIIDESGEVAGSGRFEYG